MTFVGGFAVGSAIPSPPGAEISNRVKSCDGQLCTALSGCGMLGVAGHPAVGTMGKELHKVVKWARSPEPQQALPLAHRCGLPECGGLTFALRPCWGQALQNEEHKVDVPGQKSCGPALVELTDFIVSLGWDSGNESGENLICLFPETLLMVLVAWSEPRTQNFCSLLASKHFK